MEKNCKHCGNKYSKHRKYSAKQWEQSCFCSRQCMCKGRKREYVAWNKGLKTGPLSEDHRKKLSESHKGLQTWIKGKTHSEKTKERIRELMSPTFKYYWKGRRNPHISGENSPWWRGGVTSKNKLIRSSSAYKNWRKEVFNRDNWTCTSCNKRGGNLHADHIKPFSRYPNLRLDIGNGRTLCIRCHEQTESYPRQFIRTT